MYNFDKLEKKCKIYHLKKYSFFLIPFLVLFSAGTYFILNHIDDLKIKQTQIAKKDVINKTTVIKKEKKKTVEHSEHILKKDIKDINNTSKLTKVTDNKCYYLQFFIARKFNA